MRADIWLVQNGYFSSRQRAQMAIRQGHVQANGQPVKKASYHIRESDQIEVTGDPLRYVSRGGLKLEKAIRSFRLDFTGQRVLDAGASTGGFTDCALQQGAAKVYAVDVGASQLVDAIKQHPKVIFYEKQDVRNFSLSQMGGLPVDIIVADLSFVSLTHILPAFPPLLKKGGMAVLLIKPQFEMETRTATKGGIIKNPELREKAKKKVVECAEALGFRLRGMIETDVEDERKKNIEYLAWFEMKW